MGHPSRVDPGCAPMRTSVRPGSRYPRLVIRVGQPDIPTTFVWGPATVRLPRWVGSRRVHRPVRASLMPWSCTGCPKVVDVEGMALQAVLAAHDVAARVSYSWS